MKNSSILSAIFLLLLALLLFPIYQLQLTSSYGDYARYLSEPKAVSTYSKEFLSVQFFNFYYFIEAPPYLFSLLQLICVSIVGLMYKRREQAIFLLILLTLTYTLVCVNVRLGIFLVFLPGFIFLRPMLILGPVFFHVSTLINIFFAIRITYLIFISIIALVVYSISDFFNVQTYINKFQVYLLFGAQHSLGGIIQSLFLAYFLTVERAVFGRRVMFFGFALAILMVFGYVVLASRFIVIVLVYILLVLWGHPHRLKSFARIVILVVCLYEVYRVTTMLGVSI